MLDGIQRWGKAKRAGEWLVCTLTECGPIK